MKTKKTWLTGLLLGMLCLTGCNKTQPSTTANPTTDTPTTSITTPTTSVTPTTSDNSLDLAKTAALEEVNNYKNDVDYRDAEKTQLSTLKETAKSEIESATSLEEVNQAVTKFKAAVDALKTKAEYEKEELDAYKANATLEVERYKSLDLYREAEQTLLQGYVASAKDEISKSTTQAQVDKAVEDFKQKVDALKLKSTYEQEELLAYKETKKAEIQNYKSANDYREKEQTELATAIQNALTALEGATSISNVDDIVSNFKSIADALKTKATYEAEEAAALKARKEDALIEIEDYVDPVNYRIAEENQIYDYIEKYQDKVNQATTIAAIDTLVKEFKGLVDALPTDPGFTGNLDKGASVSFTPSEGELDGANLLLLPEVHNWTGDGFAFRMKNTCGSNMYINVYLNETDSDRVGLATGATYYLYHADGRKEMTNSGRGWGYYVLIPYDFDGYVYIPFTSMSSKGFESYGTGDKNFDYNKVYGVYLETAVYKNYDHYQKYQVGEIQLLNGNTVTTVLSTDGLTSKTYTTKFIKDWCGQYIKLEFNGTDPVVDPSKLIYSGSLNGGATITFNHTENTTDVCDLLIKGQTNTWGGEGFALRIKNNAALSYITIYVNETDADRAQLAKDAPYTFIDLEGNEIAASNNRGWGSYIILPENFDGYVYFPYSSFELGTKGGDGKLTFASVWGIYLETNTYYDNYQNYVVGSIEVKNGDTVTKVLDSTTLTDDNYSANYVRDYNGTNLNIARYKEA